MCRNWEKGYCQYDTKVSFKFYFTLQRTCWLLIISTYSNFKAYFKENFVSLFWLIDFWWLTNIFEFFISSARLLTVDMNSKSAMIYRKITRPNSVKNSTDPNTIAVMDKDALLSTLDQPHSRPRPMERHLSTTRVRQILWRQSRPIAGNSGAQQAPQTTRATHKLKNCPPIPII